MIGVLG